MTTIQKYIVCFTLALLGYTSNAQLYFPPITGSVWLETDAQTLGWDINKINDLNTFLTERKTKAFIVLKDGKIVIEQYYNGHSASKPWYWASAGKSLTSSIVGIAADQGLINLDAPSSDYLGVDWAMVTPDQMAAIKVRHHLTMTTGLDDAVSFECTDPECLKFKANPGTRWTYHNAPYTLIDGIIEGGTGLDLNMYYRQVLGSKIGMTGVFIKNGYNNVFYSTARDMARYGLLALNHGKWDQTTIIPRSYADQMIETSQDLNPSYGMLWWLNGKDKVMLPGSQIRFNGPLIPTAPSDMYCGLGKFDQKIYVVPSQNLVVIRLGEEAGEDNSPVPIKFDIELWEKLSSIMGIKSATSNTSSTHNVTCYFDGQGFVLNTEKDIISAQLIDIQGKRTNLTWSDNKFNAVENLASGHYFIVIKDSLSKIYSCPVSVSK
jgi:CubicO group peptidase (beta-lactamase class C family)